MAIDDLSHGGGTDHGDDARILLSSALWLLGITLGIGSAFGLGERASARQQVASLETAIAARSPCEPKDAALGSSSGDPYTFYSFNREDELSRSREACLALASAEPTKP